MEYYLRALMLDVNFHYRDIPQDIFIKMILDRYEILRRSKKFRNESNIAERLAEEFLISTSSVYNYFNYDKKQMKYLVKGNFIDEKRLERLGARTLTEVFRK